MTAPIFVAGEPALLLTSREKAWREAVRMCAPTGLTRPVMRFVVSSWKRGGNAFDLDNLVDPVLSLVSDRGKCLSVWATCEIGSNPGVYLSEMEPPVAPGDSRRLWIAEPPTRSVRNYDPLSEVRDASIVFEDQPLGCELTLGGATPRLIFGFEGPVKPTIDALWPLLGGSAGRPADHRIRDLRVRCDSSIEGISVALWPIAGHE